jgi:hypothetical protein
MQVSKTRHASWQELLAAPPPASHVVQICDSSDFLVAGVTLFATEGLRAGQAVLLFGTQAHLLAVHRALAAAGADPDAALRAGQLSVSDAHEAVAAVMVDGRLDPARVDAVAGGTLRKLKADARFTGVRWWGEVSNLMHAQGDTQAALAAEALADALTKRLGARLLCSYCLDKFDADAYDGVLKDVCAQHSHAIPTADYVRHRLAVNRAVAEVIGDIKGPLLQSLLSWKGLGCDLPSSQALLFWLREAMPEKFRDVLSRAKAYQLGEAA